MNAERFMGEEDSKQIPLVSKVAVCNDTSVRKLEILFSHA